MMGQVELDDTYRKSLEQLLKPLVRRIERDLTELRSLSVSVSVPSMQSLCPQREIKAHNDSRISRQGFRRRQGRLLGH